MSLPCETRTSTCRSFATISSGLYRFLAIAVSWMSKTYLKSDHFNGGGSIKREERKAARVRREQRALEEKGSIALPHLTLPRSIKWELSRQRRLMAAAN